MKIETDLLAENIFLNSKLILENGGKKSVTDVTLQANFLEMSRLSFTSVLRSCDFSQYSDSPNLP